MKGRTKRICKPMTTEEKNRLAEMIREEAKTKKFWTTTAFYWLSGHDPDIRVSDAIDIVHILRSDKEHYPFED